MTAVTPATASNNPTALQECVSRNPAGPRNEHEIIHLGGTSLVEQELLPPG
jgi:hypothetical protein